MGPTSWLIDCTAVGSNYLIRRYDPTSLTWEVVEGAATEVAVDSSGGAWVVNAGGSIYHREGDTWRFVGGATSIGSATPVAVIGTDANRYQWDNSAMAFLPVGGAPPGVGPVAIAGIYELDDNNWIWRLGP
jgi:hypothetical protein